MLDAVYSLLNKVAGIISYVRREAKIGAEGNSPKVRELRNDRTEMFDTNKDQQNWIYWFSTYSYYK